ncbi:MAG: hypothetical protein WD066_12850 [Planctomycetaceae bacterium]
MLEIVNLENLRGFRAGRFRTTGDRSKKSPAVMIGKRIDRDMDRLSECKDLHPEPGRLRDELFEIMARRNRDQTPNETENVGRQDELNGRTGEKWFARTRFVFVVQSFHFRSSCANFPPRRTSRTEKCGTEK